MLRFVDVIFCSFFHIVEAYFFVRILKSFTVLEIMYIIFSLRVYEFENTFVHRKNICVCISLLMFPHDVLFRNVQSSAYLRHVLYDNSMIDISLLW